ncbi:siroheme synthase CysG [Nitratireductor sp. CH_MIT9313-5]|uniref:siroheme synthase CysG n=1 Tax=Nitratireductor sp. CH_MIT9313-5 TaxID=3107764 RepID=UPI00300B77CA
MNIVSSPRSEPCHPRHIDDLAALPVFFKLKGKRAVVAGGSDAAAWKAELLAAAGAEVHVFAAEADAALLALAESATVIHHNHDWSRDTFSGAAIAICDAETDEEAEDFFEAAREAGVPVNVIDKPAFCEFQFGSIVNRSPAVIAISTDGAAPILGQAIRRRIETLIPPALADWAGIARDIRDTVTKRLAAGQQRRAFWERFTDRAFGSAPPPAAIDELTREADSIVAGLGQHQGRVTLVGAGPGDAELLTLKAVRALQAADVILFDDLVSEDVLELARREAKRMLVGKRGGRESCRQDDINNMMVSLAKAGKHVVRLKGGDPMIFGRAGEEIARLEAAGVPVSVVPGITSALAMASSLGVSLTHRDCAQSVRFVTGHSRKGELPRDIDWKSIADPKTTTIFYMGGRTAGEIASTLINRGLPADTPVVIAKAISRPGQRQWTGALYDMSAAIGEMGYDEPVLIGVGEVFLAARGRALPALAAAPF